MARILRPDICVIGGGSGGLTVAAAAAAFGVPVVLVEKAKMGGDCLNYGCVPSKALIAAARHAETMREAARFGIATVEPEVNFGRVMRHVRSVVDVIAPNDSVARFTAMGVHVIQAEARFKDRRTVIAGDAEIRARRFVVATGSSPAIPSIEGLDTVPYLTNETIFEQTRKPGHLIVIGGGPVGIELAQAYRRLGSQVTVIEAADALGREDSEAVRIVLARLADEGVTVHQNMRVARVEKRGKSGVRVFAEKAGETLAVDGTHLLTASGRTANVEGLGLEAAGIEHDSDGIKVSARLRTSNRRVYAVGDVTGGPQFTHAANHQAGVVVRALLFRLPARADRTPIPRVTYTDPPLAHAGLSESEARAARKRVRILRWPYADNDRARAEHRTEGFIKIVADANGRLLGATIVGAGADEMIGFWTFAVSQKLKAGDIMKSIAPYPTLGEIGKRAVLSYFSQAAERGSVRRIVRFLRAFG